MKNIKSEYKSFLEDIEKNIKDKEDLKYIKERFATFLDVILEQIEYLIDFRKDEIDKLEKVQKQLDEKMSKMEKVLNNIEKDIYAEEGFDFEIMCPYCNYEFIVDMDENKTELECPECKNMIELDWSGEPETEEQHGCSGKCNKCNDCEKDEEDDEDI